MSCAMKKNSNNLIKLFFMIILTVGVQVLTLVKSTIVASTFGTTESMDAYNYANSFVSFVFGIAVAGISTIIIPEYANKRDRRVVDTFITVVYGGSLLLAVAMILLRYPIVNLFSNKGDSFITTAANILVIILPAQYLAAFSGVTTAYLQCENKHNVPKIINLLCQSGIILLLAVRNGKMDIFEYALIVAGGNGLIFLIETAAALKRDWRYQPALLLGQEEKSCLVRFLPIIFSSGVYQLSLLTDSMIASFLSTGMITILSYSTQISSMVSAVVVRNLLLYIYPQITKNVRTIGYQKHFWKQTKALHAIVCLMIAGFACVGKEAILVLLNRGFFSAEACEIVFYSSLIYIFGQGISVIRDMVYRYFYAVGNTKIPAQNSILVSICNISISLVLVKSVGFYGIIIGTVLSSVISLSVILIRFHQTIGLSERAICVADHFIRNFVILTVTIVAVYMTKLLLPVENYMLHILVFGIETVIIYAILQLLINKEVVRAIKML